MTRSTCLATLACLLGLAGACSKSSKDGDGERGDSGIGSSGGDSGVSPNDIIEGPQDPNSLLKRYMPQCDVPNALTLSGEVDDLMVEKSYPISYDPFALLELSRPFGELGTVSVALERSMDERTMPIEYYRRYPAAGHILMPIDSTVPLAKICAGKGSTFERTPVEEVFDLQSATLASCPGKPVDGQIDVCVVSGLDDDLCPTGVTGMIGSTELFGSGADSFRRVKMNYKMSLYGGHDLVFAFDAEPTGTITSGLFSTSVPGAEGTYCIGEGSTYLTEEMGFDDRITLQLRNLSKLPSCEGASGEGEVRTCYRR